MAGALESLRLFVMNFRLWTQIHTSTGWQTCSSLEEFVHDLQSGG